MAEFQYDYSKYSFKLVDEKTIDDLIRLVLDAGTGYFASIVAGCKLLCIGIFIFIKWRMQTQDLMIQKQEYQIKQGKKVQNQIDSDDLD